MDRRRIAADPPAPASGELGKGLAHAVWPISRLLSHGR